MPADKKHFTLYTTTEDREQIEDLMQRLDRLGVDVRDNRGNLSISKLVRLLVNEKLMKLIHDSE